MSRRPFKSPATVKFQILARMRVQSSATVRVSVSSKRVYGNACSLCCGWVSVGGMEAILNCRTEDLEDYYGLLGCDELSTVNTQVTTTYNSCFRVCVFIISASLLRHLKGQRLLF